MCSECNWPIDNEKAPSVTVTKEADIVAIGIDHNQNQNKVSMSKDGLVYIGKIIDLSPIEGADFIISATVVCGQGGKWRGIVRKADFALNDLCVVFLPDSQLDPVKHAYLPFMKDSAWRVKMRRFRGAPSEVLIIKDVIGTDSGVGEDVTDYYHVTKYSKPMAAHLQGNAKGNFPSFIPKTDELNYQRYGDLVDTLVGKPYYITEKADGSSTTAFKYLGDFGLCSRNLELERNPDNGYWKVALKYNLEEKLPDGIALQWETCGPGIQGNPMGLPEIEGFAFSAYDIYKHEYLEMVELFDLLKDLKFPSCKLINVGEKFSKEDIETLGEGFYPNRKPREGVVVRSVTNLGHVPISFKVINLDYDK